MKKLLVCALLGSLVFGAVLQSSQAAQAGKYRLTQVGQKHKKHKKQKKHHKKHKGKGHKSGSRKINV